MTMPSTRARLEKASEPAIITDSRITGRQIIMAERKRTRRNTLERRCLSKVFKRMFAGAPKATFKMLEKIKRA